MLNAFLYYGALPPSSSCSHCAATFILVVLSIRLQRTLQRAHLSAYAIRLHVVWNFEAYRINLTEQRQWRYGYGYGYVQLAHAYLICYFWECVCAMIVFVFIFIFMRIWARAICILRKNKARRKTRKQSAWAREVLFSVQVRFEMPKIASCSRAAAPQCAPLRGYTSVHFREFRFFWGSGTQSEA